MYRDDYADYDDVRGTRDENLIFYDVIGGIRSAEHEQNVSEDLQEEVSDWSIDTWELYDEDLRNERLNLVNSYIG